METIKSTINNTTQAVRRRAPILQNHRANVPSNGLPNTPNPLQVPKRSPAKRLLHWLYVIGKDLFWLHLVLGLIYFLDRTHIYNRQNRYFPMWFNTHTGLWEGPIEYSYPHIPMALSALNCALALLLIPLATILAMQLFVRSFWDWNAATLGLLKAMTLM